MNKLTAFLEEMKKIGENATKAPWAVCGEYKKTSDYLVSTPDGRKWRIDDAIYHEKSHNAEFIATARNNWDRLIKMNQILLEACEFYSHNEEFENLKELYKHDKSKVVVDFYGDIARKAIEKCKEIIG